MPRLWPMGHVRPWTDCEFFTLFCDYGDIFCELVVCSLSVDWVGNIRTLCRGGAVQFCLPVKPSYTLGQIKTLMCYILPVLEPLGESSAVITNKLSYLIITLGLVLFHKIIK